MTGEITLRGRVLPIGGLKEKVLAAHRAGIKLVLLPEENKKDIRDIPKTVRQAMRLVTVQHMDDVIPLALSRDVKGGPSDAPPAEDPLLQILMRKPKPSVAPAAQAEEASPETLPAVH